MRTVFLILAVLTSACLVHGAASFLETQQLDGPSDSTRIGVATTGSEATVELQERPQGIEAEVEKVESNSTSYYQAGGNSLPINYWQVEVEENRSTRSEYILNVTVTVEGGGEENRGINNKVKQQFEHNIVFEPYRVYSEGSLVEKQPKDDSETDSGEQISTPEQNNQTGSSDPAKEGGFPWDTLTLALMAVLAVFYLAYHLMS